MSTLGGFYGTHTKLLGLALEVFNVLLESLGGLGLLLESLTESLDLLGILYDSIKASVTCATQSNVALGFTLV